MKAIALDLGTSGFRAQAIENGIVLGTAITTRHPLPGANIMDHLHFCIELGNELTHSLILKAIISLLTKLPIDPKEVTFVGVCGNPIQLSLFQGIEVRDLAYAGPNALKRLGIEPLKRDAKVVRAADIGLERLPNASVYIPPVIKHEIGADALAMMYMTGMLDRDEIALVTDYGTNAEMALMVGGDIYTGSAAAGPALEGQHISSGMLASPGAIADIRVCGDFWQCYILNHELASVASDTVNPLNGVVLEKGAMHGKGKGITGTGVVSALAVGIDNKIVGPPSISSDDGLLHFQDEIYISEKDIREAGKAIGAIRAGHLTLAESASISLQDIEVMYMTGASGTYVDAAKAQKTGLVPACVKKIVQAGNTSLAMAVELVRNPGLLDKLQVIADGIRANHVMFANSKVFQNAYTVELAYWDEGMPFPMFNQMLGMYKIQTLPEAVQQPKIVRLAQRDIIDIGEQGLKVIHRIGTALEMFSTECSSCHMCAFECPEGAIEIFDSDEGCLLVISTDRCNGTACRRCESICPKNIIRFEKMRIRDEGFGL